MDGLNSSSYFQVLQSLYRSFGDCTKRTKYDWHHRHFHVPQFFNFLTRSMYLSFFSLSFSFTLWLIGTTKSTIRQVLFFCLFRSGRLAKTRRSIFISKSPKGLCISFSRTDSGFCIYHLFLGSDFNFLHNSQCIIWCCFMLLLEEIQLLSYAQATSKFFEWDVACLTLKMSMHISYRFCLLIIFVLLILVLVAVISLLWCFSL